MDSSPPTRQLAQDSAWALRTRADRERARHQVARDSQTGDFDPVSYEQPTADVDPAAQPQVTGTFLSRSEPVVDAVSYAREMTTGSVLSNRYLLGRSLGTGGGALIFQAEDRRRIGAADFGSKIAIKVLRPEMRHNAHALTRLKREFRQMQRLDHPGIARVFELVSDEDIWFMTMELIDGQTVNHWLRSVTSKAEALQIIVACCDALSHAHEAGVIHGDLKPSNVLVLADGNVKLVDFGSAAERDTATGEVDKERSFAATPPYASPQVLAGEIADPRDDVFSLACLAYAVLTQGEHPFDRKSSAEAVQAHMKPTYSKALSPRQFGVIAHALAWEREQRPASVRDFMHALLASNLGHDAPTRETQSSAVLSKPIPDVPTKDTPTVGVVKKEAVAPQARKPLPIPEPKLEPKPKVKLEAKLEPKVELKPEIKLEPKAAPKPEPQPEVKPEVAPEPPSKPVSNVRPEDIARLKAAVAAAEAHADQIEHPAAPAPEKPRDQDPLAKFRGYVAGPKAHHNDETSEDVIAPPVSLAKDAAAATPPTPSQRVWPWQRSAWVVAILMIGSGIGIAMNQQRNLDPIATAKARPAPPAPVETAPAATIAIAAPIEPAQVEEKKSPAVVKPSAPRAAPGEVTFATRTLHVGVGQTMAALTVKREKSTRGRARVNWTIEGGTARDGVDYQLGAVQTIQFLDGQSVRSLFIPLAAEKDVDSARTSKTFTVKLQPAKGGPKLGTINQVHVTIVGDVATEESVASSDESQ